MTDHEEDQVRRLLAEARHTDPIPPDVAARMDGVLADLASDEPVRPAVTDLAAARRRRRVGTLLVAAAAVVVLGVGFDQLRDAGLGSSADSGSAGGSADGATSAERSQLDEGAADSGADVPEIAGVAGSPRLDPDRFGRQVLALRGLEKDALLEESGVTAFEGCRPPGRGTAVVVRYDGSPAVLVYRPVRGDSQVVDLYRCGQDRPIRSITLPAP